MQKGHILSFDFGWYSIYFDIVYFDIVRGAIFGYQAKSVTHDESNLLIVPQVFGAEMWLQVGPVS